MKLLKISFLFFYMLTSVSGVSYCYSQTGKDSLNYYYKAIIDPQNSEHLPSGIHFFSRRKQSDLATGDTLSVIRNLRLLAIGEFKIGNYYDSENHIVEALDLINGSSKWDTLLNAKVGLYNQLGRIYRASNNPDQALLVFDKALKLGPTAKDSIILLNNKANIYKDLEEYENAISIYSILHQKSLLINDSLQLASVLDNLGYSQSKINSPDALENLLKALQLRSDKNYLSGMYSSYRNLAEYYLTLDNRNNAMLYAEKGFEVAQKMNSSSFKLDALSLFMTLDDNPKVLEYKKLKDSFTLAQQIAENKDAYLKYNVAQERKRTEASKLLQEIESRKRLRYQFLSFIIFSVLIASYFIFRYRNKQLKLATIYKTETRIAKKVHDEVANDMYKVMVVLEKKPSEHEHLLNEMEKIYTKTRDISRENRSLDVEDDFESLLNDLFFEFKNNEVAIVTRNLSEINWKRVSEVKKRTVYRVLQELLTNMKKHSKASTVALIFAKKGAKTQIKYSDNGVGCDLKHKNGLRNTETRIASINGTISFESSKDNGFKATIIV